MADASQNIPPQSQGNKALIQGFKNIPLQNIPQELGIIVKSITAGGSPEGWWVALGSPGNFFGYLKKILTFILFFMLIVGLLILGIGGLTALIAQSTEVQTIAFTMTLVGFFALGFICFFILIPNLIIRWRFNSFKKKPGFNSISLSAHGLLILGQSLFGTRASLIPWKEIQYLKMRSFNTLGFILQLSPSLFGPSITDNYQWPLSIIHHALQSGWRQFQDHKRVSIKKIIEDIEPLQAKGKAVLPTPLPFTLGGPTPQETLELVMAHGDMRYFDHTQTYQWNLPARSLFRTAVWMFLLIPLFLPILIMPWIFLYKYFYRGPKNSWFMCFLPQGLIIQNEQGTIVLPYSVITHCSSMGHRVQIHTPHGSIFLDGEAYRIHPQTLNDRIQALKEAST